MGAGGQEETREQVEELFFLSISSVPNGGKVFFYLFDLFQKVEELFFYVFHLFEKVEKLFFFYLFGLFQ